MLVNGFGRAILIISLRRCELKFLDWSLMVQKMLVSLLSTSMGMMVNLGWFKNGCHDFEPIAFLWCKSPVSNPIVISCHNDVKSLTSSCSPSYLLVRVGIPHIVFQIWTTKLKASRVWTFSPKVGIGLKTIMWIVTNSPSAEIYQSCFSTMCSNANPHLIQKLFIV